MNYRAISLGLFGLVVGMSAANATEIDNTSLTTPPGVYFGTGNANSGFTVDRANGVETGLSAINRFIGPITPTGSVYTVPLGPTTVSGKTGAEWGFDYSVNVNYDGSSGLSLSDVTTLLTVTDLTTSATGSFDPSSPLFGNSTFLNYAFQNSEPANILGINEFATDSYSFLLTVTKKSDNSLLSSDQITVNAVPEPFTLSLFGAGLAGAAALRRRKKKALQA